MSSWSKRRKFTYAFIVIIVAIGVLGVPAFFIFYHPPTCSDGLKNGDEQGVDCGGSCKKLCQSAFLPPEVSWTRFEQVSPGLYNMAAYIVNPNTDVEAVKVPYVMTAYDDQGIAIVESRGTVTIPPHRNTIAFKSAVDMGKRTPSKILFEFAAAPDWHKRTDPLAALFVTDKNYSEDKNGSSLSITMENQSVYPIGRTAVYVILFDKNGNTLGFSRTILDEIAPQAKIIAPFTWPVSHNNKVISIEVLPVAE